LKSPAVDFLLQRMQDAQTLEQLQDASRALDRVIMQGWYQIPDLYAPTDRVSRWDRFGMPATPPRFYTIESGLDVWPVWPLTTWWAKDVAASVAH
jgi:microcin C transport system substrate-binding protein